jgi:hypothetical protein
MTRLVTTITLAAFFGGSCTAAFGLEDPFRVTISAASKNQPPPGGRKPDRSPVL